MHVPNLRKITLHDQSVTGDDKRHRSIAIEESINQCYVAVQIDSSCFGQVANQCIAEEVMASSSSGYAPSATVVHPEGELTARAKSALSMLISSAPPRFAAGFCLPISRLSGSACRGRDGPKDIFGQMWQQHCHGGWAKFPSKPVDAIICATTSESAPPVGWEPDAAKRRRKAALRTASESITEEEIQQADDAVMYLPTHAPDVVQQAREPTIEITITMEPTAAARLFFGFSICPGLVQRWPG